MWWRKKYKDADDAKRWVVVGWKDGVVCQVKQVSSYFDANFMTHYNVEQGYWDSSVMAEIVGWERKLGK